MPLPESVPVLHSFLSKALKRSYPVIIFVFLVLSNSPVSGGDKGYAKPAEKDKCPVCGMFVAKYPDWIAEVVFRDGAYRVFDGSKDMFKYLADLKKFDPSRKPEDIAAIYVTDYYDVRPVDAHKAYFVIGGDVYGPMGAELVPFEKQADAREFHKDHDGRRILRFSDVTPDILKAFD